VVVVTAQRNLEGIYRAATLVCPQRRRRTPLRGTTPDGKSKLEDQRPGITVFSDALHYPDTGTLSTLIYN